MTSTKFVDRDVRLVDLPPDPLSEIEEGSGPAIGIGDQLSPLTVLDYAALRGFEQIVQRSGHSLDREVASSILMLKDKRLFLDYPLSSILRPAEAGDELEKQLRGLDIEIDSSGQKASTLAAIEGYLSGVARPGLIQDAMLIADELFTNAIYNASFEAEKADNPLAEVHRKKNTKITGKARIFVGCDNECIIVGCEDSFGSLDPSKLIDGIRNCIRNGVAKSINFGSGGAGIGSFMIFETSASYYIGVARGSRTVVCASLPLRKGLRQRAAMPKNFHLVTMEGSEL